MNARTLLTTSFLDCGILADGESLSASQAQDGLRRLNNMVSSWRTQYGTVLSIDRNVFDLTADQQTYTIGPGGDFNVARPLTIPAAALLLNGNSDAVPVEIPRPVITVAAYESIQLKNLPNNQFTLVYYHPIYPLGEIFLWPLPDIDTNRLVLYLQNAFTGFADLTSDSTWPDNPGYGEALQYQLDLRLLTPYGVPPAIGEPLVGLAQQSFGLIKRANNRLTDLSNDAGMFAHDPRAGYNINVGGTG